MGLFFIAASPDVAFQSGLVAKCLYQFFYIPIQIQLNTVNDKVDKVNGKVLSSNDYTTTEKNKLAGIANNATAVTDSTVSGWG